MPGIRIDVDTSGAISNLAAFRKALEDSGVAAKMSDRELAALADRFREKLAADKAAGELEKTSRQIENIGKAAGLSEKELAAFQNRMGSTRTHASAASEAVSATSAAMSSMTGTAASVGESMVGMAGQLAIAAGAYLSLREAVSAVRNAIGDAARYEMLGSVMKVVGENVGYTKSQMEVFQKQVESLGISSIDARQSLTRMAEANLDLARTQEIARAAQDAGRIAGISSSEAFDRMTRAISSNMVVTLHRMGIMVNFQKAEEDYARSLHTTTSALTEKEKAEARAAATVESAKRSIAGTYDAAQNTVGGQMLSFQRYQQNLSVEFGKGFLGGATDVVREAAESMKRLTDIISQPETQQAIESMSRGIADMMQGIIRGVPDAVQSIVSLINVFKQAWADIPDEAKTFMKYASVGVAGLRFGPWGAVAAMGGTALYSNGGKELLQSAQLGLAQENASRMNNELYSNTDPAKTKELEENLNAQIALIAKIANGQGMLKTLSDDIQSRQPVYMPKDGETAEEIARNTARAAANKQWNSYQEIYDKASVFTQTGASYLPKDQQIRLENERYEGLISQLGRALVIAKEMGVAQDEVNKLQSAVVIADEQHKENLQKINSHLTQTEQLYRDISKAAKELEVSNMASESALAGDKWGSQLSKIQGAYETKRDEISAKSQLTSDPELLAQYARQFDALSRQNQLAQMTAEKDMLSNSKFSGITGGYVAEQSRQELQAELNFLKDRVEDETALRIYAAQRSAKIKEDEIKARIGSEQSFSDYLRDQAALDLGITRSSQQQQLDEWKTYYDDLKSAATSFSDTIKNGLVDVLDGIATGKAEDAWKNMLSSLRRQFLQFMVNIAFDWAQKNIFSSIVSGAVGAQGALSATSPVVASTIGLTSQGSVVSSPVGITQFVPQITSFVQSQTQQNNTVASALGSIAAKYESGSNYGMVSSGNKWGDPGGISYGKYQLSSTRGSAAEFLKFAGISDHPDIGTQAFGDWWKRQGNEPDFQKAQEAFAQEKFYKPVMQHLQSMGYSGDNAGVAEAVFATSIAHGTGGANKILDRALSGRNTSSLSNEELVNLIYDERTKGQGNGLTYWASSPASVQSSVKARLLKEQQDVLALTGMGTAVTRDKLASKGILGTTSEDATQGIYTGASNYGVFGALLGTQGAQTLMGRLSYNGGMMSILGGDSVNSTFLSQVASTTPSAGGASTVALAMMGGKAATQNVVNLTGGGSSSDMATNIFSGLMAQGYSADQAAQITSQLVSMQSSSSQTAATTTQQGTSSGGNDMLGDLTKNGGSSWTSKLDQWGYDNLGIGSMTPNSWVLNGSQANTYEALVSTGEYTPEQAWNIAASGNGTSLTGGLGTMAGGALTGAMTGYGISSLVYPNGTATVGGTVGGLVGGAAGSALLGSIGGPIGGLVGGLLGSVLTGSETTKTEKTGSGITVTINNGNISQQGYSTYRTTTSGMFGSSSTSHSKAYDTVGDPELEAQFRSVFEKYQNQTFRSLINLGMTSQLAGIQDFSFPMSIDYDSSNASFAAKSMANYQAYLAITNSGMQEEFDAVAKSGEVYVDELERISNAYSKGAINAKAAGTSLETLSGSMSKVFQGDWFSRLSDLLGGDDQAAAAFTNYTKYGLSQTQAEKYLLSATGSTAGTAIAEIGDSSVNVGNFWSKYGEAMNTQMSADGFALWANAAAAMAQYSDAQRYTLTLMQNANNVRISQLKAEIDAVQNVKVMVDGVKTSVASAYSTYKGLNETLISTLQSLKWSSLSPNTTTTTFQQQQAYYNELKAKVLSEDSSSLTYSSDVQKLSSFAQTYLQTAKSYYGSSSQYWSIYNEVSGNLTDLQKTTQTELDVLSQQLAAQYDIINKNQEQIDNLTLINENLAILGSGIDGLGASIIDGLNNITNALGSDSTASWAATIADSISAANAAIASFVPTTGATSTDTSSSDTTDMTSLYASYLGGYASGGDVQGPGWFMAGENGPEPVVLKGGSRASVTSNGDLTGMLDAGNKISAAGLSALLQEIKGLRQETAAMRATNERLAARPNRSN